MNFFKRALRNVQRKTSKTILLIITFFVIGNFVILGLAVSNAAENAKTATRKSMNAVVNYQIDYQSLWDYTDGLTDEEMKDFEYPQITIDELEQLAADERVKTISINNYQQLYSDDFETIKLNNSASEQENNRSCWTDENGNEVCQAYRQPDLNIRTNLFPNNIEFEDGSYELTDGRMYTQDEIDDSAPVCLITRELAELNGLGVGDTIGVFVSDPNSVEEGGYAYGYMTHDDLMMNLEIIGVFENNNTLDPSSEEYDWLPSSMAPGNVILMPLTTSADMQFRFSLKSWEMQKEMYPDQDYYDDPENAPKFEDFVYINMATFLLDDPLVVDDFIADHSSELQADFKILDANNEMFEKLSKPLDTMGMFADFIVWLVVINAIIIITLITALTLKTREYEIGVLLSLGTTKLKIISQFFVELAIVALIGFSLANISGSALAGRVGEVAWSYQAQYDGIITADDSDSMIDTWYGYGNDDYFTDITFEDVSGNYQVSISPLIIGEIYLAGLGIVLIAILIPSLMIMRFSPKRILMSAQ